MSAGIYHAKKSALRKESGVPIILDWTERNEIVGGATISSATVDVMLEDDVSVDLTVASILVVTGGKKVQWILTDYAAVVGFVYKLVCAVTLSTGEVLPDSVDVKIMPA